MTHDDAIDMWVAASVPRCTDFSTLVRSLPGVYPSEVVRSLDRLGATLPMPKSELLLAPVGPTPHPADADWRFDEETCAALVDEVIMRCKGGGKAVLLGCPSLYVQASRQRARASLIEENVGWRRWLQSQGVHVPEVGSGDPKGLAANDVVIGDPPWYLPDYRYFVSLAGQLSKPGAVLLLTWPPAGARPGLEEEWRELLGAAALFGWRFVANRQLAVGYATPWFEAQALRAAGLPVLKAWRRGDLAVFERTAQQPPTPLAPPGQPWIPATFGFVDLRVRHDEAPMAAADPRLRSIISGDVLPSVSRRDPAWAHARVCSAGNRVFACARPDLLLEIIGSYQLGASAGCARIEQKLDRGLEQVERNWCLETWDRLRILEAAERRDYDAAHEAASPPLNAAVATSRLRNR